MGTFIPPYTPSGNGSMNDLKSIQTSQIIAWGGFRSKLGREYKKIAGTEIIDGHEVFKSINIANSLGDETDPIYEFLKLYGFSKEDLFEMNEDRNNSSYKISSMYLEYKAGVSYSEETFEQSIDKIFSYIQSFDTLRVTVKEVGFPDSLSDDDAKLLALGLRDVGMNWNIRRNQNSNTESTDDTFKISGGNVIPNLEVFLRTIDVEAIKNGVNVSDTIPVAMLEILSLIAAVEQGVTATQVGQIKVSLETRSGASFKMVRKTEDFTFSGSISGSMKTRYDEFHDQYRDHTKCDNKTDEECDKPVAKDDWTSLVFDSFAEVHSVDMLLETNGLFYAKPPVFQFNDSKFGKERLEDIKVYMTVEGLKKARPDVFGYYASAYMDIRVKINKGGFLKRFFTGLIRAVLSLLSAVLEIFLKIPILKQITMLVLKAISKIFGVDIQGAKDILAMIALSVIMYFAAGALSGALNGTSTVASGTMIGLESSSLSSLTLFSEAMGMFNQAQAIAAKHNQSQMEIRSANEEYKKEQEKLEDPIEVAFFGTMGSFEQHQESDYMMYHKMFNPFENFNQAIPSLEFNNNNKGRI